MGEGLKHYQRALEVCPAYAPAHYNVGVVHSEAREYEAALQAGTLNSAPFCF